MASILTITKVMQCATMLSKAYFQLKRCNQDNRRCNQDNRIHKQAIKIIEYKSKPQHSGTHIP